MSAVLLDTCAAIWLGEGARMARAAMTAIETAAARMKPAFLDALAPR